MAKLRQLLGERMRALRRGRKLTQTELGKILDLDYRYIGGIERGEINLTLDTIEKIAAGFNIEPFELFLFSGEDRSEIQALKIEKLLKETLEVVDIEAKQAVLQLLGLFAKHK